MENRHLAALFGVLILLFAVMFYSYDRAASDIASAACPGEVDCPHEQVMDAQRVVIAALIAVILALLAFIFLKRDAKAGETALHSEAAQEKKAAALTEAGIGKLEDEERQVYLLLKEKGGSLFQSDLIRETGFTKVKVSRLLDRLESKGILERRRRGMANIIVLR